MLRFSVDELLELSDKYDLAIVKGKCVKFLTASTDNPLFKLRIADKYELSEIKVIIPVYYSSWMVMPIASEIVH